MEVEVGEKAPAKPEGKVRWSAQPAWPVRIGMLLAAPARALGAIERGGKGLSDMALLLAVGVACLRADDVARALLAYPRAGILDIVLRVLQFVAGAVRDAAWIVLPAAIVLTILARRGLREPNRNLDLAAACYVPTFVVQAVLRVVELTVGEPLPLRVRQGALVVAGAWTMWLCVRALGIVRSRVAKGMVVDGAASDSVASRPSIVAVADPVRVRSGAVGAALLALLGMGLLANVVWMVRYADVLTPRGRGPEGALAFRLPRVDGNEGAVDLADFDGQVVLLDFWATWCLPCIQMMPSLHALADKWQPHGVHFIGVHTPDVPREEIAAFLAKHPVPYPIVQDDAQGSTAAQFKVMSLPHLVLLDRNGQIAREFWGYTTERQLDDAIGKAVAR